MLYKPYLILKEAIHVVSSLHDNGPFSVKKSIKNKEVETLIGVTGDQWALIINAIIDHVISYVADGISYKIYFRSREGSTLVIVVYISHQMVKEGKKIDLCELLRTQLVENIKMTKYQGIHFGLVI